MIRPAGKTSTRERFLEVAAELFHEQGYEQTPVAQILERTGVGAGSFYYHFESKEDLLLAVLERYQGMLPDIFEEPARRASDDPIGRIAHILDFYRRFLLEHDFRLGCPVGNLALEVGGQIPGVARKTAAVFEHWRAMIRRCLDDAAARLPEDLDRAELAALVLTVIEGGIMQARMAHSIDPFDASVRQLRRYLDQLTSTRGGN